MTVYNLLCLFTSTQTPARCDNLHSMGTISVATVTIYVPRVYRLATLLLLFYFNIRYLICWFGGVYNHKHILLKPPTLQW